MELPNEAKYRWLIIIILVMVTASLLAVHSFSSFRASNTTQASQAKTTSVHSLPQKKVDSASADHLANEHKLDNEKLLHEIRALKRELSEMQTTLLSKIAANNNDNEFVPKSSKMLSKLKMSLPVFKTFAERLQLGTQTATIGRGVTLFPSASIGDWSNSDANSAVVANTGCSYATIAKQWATDDVDPLTFQPHFFAPFEEHLCKYRHRQFTLIEIGRGLGGSVYFYKQMFPKATIVSLDVAEWRTDKYSKPAADDPQIRLVKASQTDNTTLSALCDQYKNIDVIIDDGAHVSKTVVATFEMLFPCLRFGGTYIIEDTQTSYLSQWQGSCDPTAKTTMNYFKNFTEQLNHYDIPRKGNKWFVKHQFAEQIVSVHFYHALIVVVKGKNEPKGYNLKNYVDRGCG